MGFFDVVIVDDHSMVETGSWFTALAAGFLSSTVLKMVKFQTSDQADVSPSMALTRQ
jgi:hypothetical protein